LALAAITSGASEATEVMPEAGAIDEIIYWLLEWMLTRIWIRSW
jgi:hypothetical protein